MPIDKWQKVIDVNLTGAFLFSQAAARDMLKVQYGRIINVVVDRRGIARRSRARTMPPTPRARPG